MVPSSRISADQDRDLQGLQRRRKHTFRAGCVLGVLLLLVTDSRWRTSNPHLYHLIEHGSTFLIVLCIMGRTWCTLYIGGLKKRELVRKGPYSVVRNPLYTFTIIGAVGIGAQSGSITTALIFAVASLLIFCVVVREEERFLAATFANAFADYTARVPRFWPRFSQWQDANELVVKPHLVRRTFLDTSLFLLAVPIVDLIEWGRDLRWLPVVVYLP